MAVVLKEEVRRVFYEKKRPAVRAKMKKRWALEIWPWSIVLKKRDTTIDRRRQEYR